MRWRKRSQPCPARDLYDDSSLWRGRRAYAERSGAPWCILSAKYGLLAPEVRINPYDLALKHLKRGERRQRNRCRERRSASSADPTPRRSDRRSDHPGGRRVTLRRRSKSAGAECLARARPTRVPWRGASRRCTMPNVYARNGVGATARGVALLRWRPNQSLRRRRGRRQLDPSRRGEERQRVWWPTVLLSSATDGGLPLVLARLVRGLSTHQGSGCPRRLRTAATGAKCHRAPVGSHRIANQMPTGPSMSRRRAPHAASPLPRG